MKKLDISLVDLKTNETFPYCYPQGESDGVHNQQYYAYNFYYGKEGEIAEYNNQPWIRFFISPGVKNFQVDSPVAVLINTQVFNFYKIVKVIPSMMRNIRQKSFPTPIELFLDRLSNLEYMKLIGENQ